MCPIEWLTSIPLTSSFHGLHRKKGILHSEWLRINKMSGTINRIYISRYMYQMSNNTFFD